MDVTFRLKTMTFQYEEGEPFSATFSENQFDRVTSGHPVLDQAYDLVRTFVKAA